MEKSTFYKEIVRFLEEQGEEASYQDDYSGRGMYGDTTPAIITDCSLTTIATAGLRIIEFNELAGSIGEAADMIAELLPRRRDNFGLHRVYY